MAPLGERSAQAGEEEAGMKFAWCLSPESQTIYREQQPQNPRFRLRVQTT